MKTWQILGLVGFALLVAYLFISRQSTIRTGTVQPNNGTSSMISSLAGVGSSLFGWLTSRNEVEAAQAAAAQKANSDFVDPFENMT